MATSSVERGGVLALLGESSIFFPRNSILLMVCVWDVQLIPIACRAISYTGTYQPNGNSYLAIYGWTVRLQQSP